MSNNETDQIFVLDDQERFMIKSWTKFTKTLKYFLLSWVLMFICTILMFDSAHFFWEKTILVLLSVTTLFLGLVTVILILVIHQGKPNSELRDSLLNYRDSEAIATANNFYQIIIKMYLWPLYFMSVMLVVSQITPYSRLLSRTSTLPFLILLIASMVLLYRIRSFIKKARRSINPALFEGNSNNT